MFVFIIITVIANGKILEELVDKKNHGSRWVEFKIE